MRILKLFSLLLVAVLMATSAFSQKSKGGTIITKNLLSNILRGTTTGLDSNRMVKVYLPPTYAGSTRSYPVVYYFHSVFSSAEKTLENGKLVSLIEPGFDKGVVKEFIMVVADYSSPTTGSLYENSTSTGRWLDFTANELVPFIDTNFRTLQHRNSRAVVGEMMGGRGAFMLGMKYPETFSLVYAMNPVGTSIGILPIQSYPNWRKIHLAKSFTDLDDDHISQLFVTMSQAFLPNPNRPPFYCDFLMEMENNEPTFNPENAQKHIAAFLLGHQLDLYANNLRKLRGIGFDWARYDPIQDHVSGSVSLSRKLETYGIEHEAEEYRGVYWEENWKAHGRFYARVLPFLNQHLVFDSRN